MLPPGSKNWQLISSHSEHQSVIIIYNLNMFGISIENYVIEFATLPLKLFSAVSLLIYSYCFCSPTTFNYHLINAASCPNDCVHKPACNSE